MDIRGFNFDKLLNAEFITAEMSKWPDRVTAMNARIAYEAICKIIENVTSVDGVPRVINHDLNSLDCGQTLRAVGLNVIEIDE